MNRHDRRANWAKARKTQQGLAQLQVAAQKLKGLETLPDALKDVQAILEGVNEMRVAMACAIQDIGSLEREKARRDFVLVRLLQTIDPNQDWAARLIEFEAEYDAAYPPEQEEAPVEPTPET